MKTLSCPFCEVPEKKRVVENRLAIAIFDQYPVQKGHLLIIPKRHVSSYFETTEDEILAMHRMMQEGKSFLDKKFKPDGYNIGVNIGKYGGQTIFHLHIHLIPRYQGDIEHPAGGIRKAIPNVVPYPGEGGA